MTQSELKKFRDVQFRKVTTELGVYALCDFDRTPIYVGQATSVGERGINGRSRRHVTSARTDPIANRRIDVWEIAFVWTWGQNDREKINELEASLFNYYNGKSPLLNGKVLGHPDAFANFELPKFEEVQILPDEEIERRRDPRLRLPRQIQQISQLLDWVLNVKDTADLRRTLQAHFERATRHYEAFTGREAPEPGDAEDQD